MSVVCVCGVKAAWLLSGFLFSSFSSHQCAHCTVAPESVPLITPNRFLLEISIYLYKHYRFFLCSHCNTHYINKYKSDKSPPCVNSHSLPHIMTNFDQYHDFADSDFNNDSPDSMLMTSDHLPIFYSPNQQELRRLMQDYNLIHADHEEEQRIARQVAGGHVLFSILTSYLKDFWRHELELKCINEKDLWTKVTGISGAWWDRVEFSSDEAESSPEPNHQHHQQRMSNAARNSKKKTRWQEVAESLFAQMLKIDRFNPHNTKHIRGLHKILHKGDDELKTIVRNYLRTI